MTAPIEVTRTEFKAGDVVRYDAAERHCREGMAVAETRLDGVVLFDTFWRSAGDRHLLTYDELATAEVVFNLDDYDELTERQSVDRWEMYKLADRETITSQHGLVVRWFVRTGAAPDLQMQIENACVAFLDAQSKLQWAEVRVTNAWLALEQLEAKR